MVESPILGVLLAGGQSRRMGGGDKCLRDLGGRPVLARVIERAAPQVDQLIINANGEPARFGAFGLPVVADSIDDFAGPLAGVLAGLDWAAAARPDTEFVVSFPTDAPFFPNDLVEQFKKAIEEGAGLVCARSDGRAHPVFGIWRVTLREDLRTALVDENLRKVDQWTSRHNLVEVDFPTVPFDPFFNINQPNEYAIAKHLLE